MTSQVSTKKHSSANATQESSSLIGAYLRDIRGVPLLKPEEEIELALKIEKGDQDARSRMIKSNLRLVVKIAKAYVNRGVPFMDLIEEGNIGLMKGVERFKAEKGFRFSTYGSWWIRQAIERAVFKQGRTVRVPVHVMEDSEKLRRNRRKLLAELGRDPTIDEESERTGFDNSYIERLREVTQSICSLETMVSDDSSLELSHTLPDENSEDPLENIWEEESKELLKQAIDRLGEREAAVLRLRHGLGGAEPCTLKEIGLRIGVTRERVRQIERDAIGRLRTVMVEAARRAA